MEKLKCLIVDDEPLAVDLLERYVSKTPFLELAGKFGSATEALSALQDSDFQLIFLDIQMPDLTGMEFSKILPGDKMIIFTTAFSNYAIEGYKVNTVGYLLKPFNYDEFLNAANKALNLSRLEKAKKDDQKDSKLDFIFVKSEYKQVKIVLDDVIYFEGLKDYIKIWLKNSPKAILTIMSLKSLENILPKDKFMRVHRSFIISLNNIQVVERSQVIMPNGERITLADQYKTTFQEFINRNSVQR